MNPFSPTLKRLGTILFSTGILLAFALTALMVWADVEALYYGFPRVGNEPMRGLSCPVFTNGAENTSFSLTLKNTTEKTLRPGVQIYISQPGLSRWRAEQALVQIEPGESKTITWDLGADDIVMSTFVLVKAYTYASYPQPDVEGSCGIFVTGIPWLNGRVLYWLWMVVSLVSLAAGLWISGARKVQAGESALKGLAQKVLAGLAALGLVAGSAGWWTLGIIVLLFIALMLPAVLFWGSEQPG